jgi:hypothetical protein
MKNDYVFVCIIRNFLESVFALLNQPGRPSIFDEPRFLPHQNG